MGAYKVKKLVCKVLGHKWDSVPFSMTRDYCGRCLVEKVHPRGDFVGNKETFVGKNGNLQEEDV